MFKPLKALSQKIPTLGARNVRERGEESTKNSSAVKRGRVIRPIRGSGRGRRIRETGRGRGTGRERRTKKSDDNSITRAADSMGERKYDSNVISDGKNGFRDNSGRSYVGVTVK